MADGFRSTTPNVQSRSRRLWVPALITILSLAIGAITWWLWQQREHDARATQNAGRLQSLLERNKALRRELEATALAEKPICRPGETLREISASSGSAIEPPATGNPPSPKVTGPATNVLSNQEMAQRLELATAMVVVLGKDSVSTGSGFFIGPQLLITNQHVVESSTNGRVLLVSKSLKSVRPGTVVRATGTSQTGSADFALVRMDQGQAPGTLDMSSEVSKLAAVVAAGYPAVVTQNDPNFRRLIEGGDVGAAPDLSVVKGEIQSLQNSSQGISQLVHTAPISGGNSGGPLVDACGRVIGVNTFIAVDQKQSARVSYAISSKAMASFVTASGATIRQDARNCNS